MKLTVNFVLILFFLILLPDNSENRGVNGGISCAACTVTMGVALQLAEVHREDFVNITRNYCEQAPTIVKNLCLKIISELEPFIDNLSQKITPDLFCLLYGTCTVDDGQELCHLFPLPIDSNPFKIDVVRGNLDSIGKLDFCQFPIIERICDILNASYISLDAVVDFDKDGFSYMPTARGADWRGKDCSDSDPDTYPGRKPWQNDLFSDSNCNGIWGVDTKTEIAYEKKFCKKSQSRGLIFIGDSIGAHFHMPEVWIDPLIFQMPGLNASAIILDEIDWPQYGFATGYKNITENIWIKGSTDSIYLRLRARNRCNHRDYQNLSQNGATSYEGINHARSLIRNQSADHPAIVFYAMQGNDVCNNFNDTVNHMTPPLVFRKNVMKTLLILNEKLPKNSHVILVGLVNGRFIYPAMHNRLHPIGKLHQNVRYSDMYNWFNCMQIGPCNGWLNSNETLRKITTEKAAELTNMLKDIVRNEQFEYFKLHFIENPLNILIRKHKDINDFLEPVDSLHPNQKAQPLIAQVIWNLLENSLPSEILGPINVHNKDIELIFGDQGGH